MATAAAYPHAFYPLHGHHLQDHEVGPSLTLINLWLRTRGFNENDFRSGAVVAEVVGATVPDYWFVDSELFCPWSTWLARVGESANAEARRKAGESDTTLAARVSSEFIGRYNRTVANASETPRWKATATIPSI